MDGAPSGLPTTEDPARELKYHGATCWLRGKDESFNRVNESERTELDIIIDSGACGTVFPTDAISHAALHVSPGSKGNQTYKAARGSDIFSVGERRCLVAFGDGPGPVITQYQDADVRKPVLSVTTAAEEGCERVLVGQGGFLSDTTAGHWASVKRKGDVYTTELLVRDAGSARSGVARPE